MCTRVLIADRDSSAVGSCREYLATRGFEVVTATGGVECVTKLKETKPDLLVLAADLLWGGADGVLAVMRQAADLAAVPVVLLAGPLCTSLTVWARSPVRSIQFKPVPPDRLLETMRTMVRR